MKNKSLLFIGALLALLTGLGLARPAQARVVDEVAVVVDQDAMTKAELEESIQEILAEQKMTSAKPGSPEYESAKKLVLDGFIREVLLAEEADRQKVEIQDGDIDHQVSQAIDNMKRTFASEQEFNDGLKKQGITLDQLKQDIHDKLLRRTKAGHAMRLKQQSLPTQALVTDTDVQNYYNQHPTDFEQVKFSMILFQLSPRAGAEKVKEVETLAQAALKQLKAGADFAKYAREHSEDKDSGANGGEIGTLSRSSFDDPQLAKGVFAIPAKGIGLVRAQNGIYIIKVEFKGKADYATAAPEIKDHLQKEKQDSALNQWVESLKKNAYIVVDGKVIPYAPATSSPNNGPVVTTSPSNQATPTSSNATVPETKVASTQVDASSNTRTADAEVFPTLPAGGSFTFFFGADGFNYGTQDLANYYGSGISTNQGFPFGFGLDIGMDYALDPTFQIGLMGEGVRKVSENVTDAAGDNELWISSIIGPSLQVKLLIPLDDSTNFILSGAGGYYLMAGSGVTISSASVTENVNFSSSNWGAQGEATLEFLLDQHKNTAMDIGAGYRYVKFTNISTQLTDNVNGNGPVKSYPSPLTNADGSPALIDFSGLKIDLSVRFFLDKNP